MDEKKYFIRGNNERVTFEEMIKIIAKYIADDINHTYEITVGTDSQNHSMTKMVEVIAVCRKGKGGIYFHHDEYITRINSLKQKIVEETSRSLENANGFFEALALELMDYNIDIETDLTVHFGIHCDIGHDGKTSTLINEITKWVEAMGYEYQIKPFSYCASGIANKHSK